MPSASKAATFSGSVGQPRQVGVFEHVVEREEPPHQHFRGSDPSSAPVPRAERPVDLASVDSAHAAEAAEAGRVLLDGHALRDELANGAAHLLVVATQEGSVHCALVKTPPWKQARAIHSARRPVQPKGSSAFARSFRWTVTVIANSPLPFAVEPVRRWRTEWWAAATSARLQSYRSAFRTVRPPASLSDLRRRNGAMTVALPPFSRS